MRCYMITRIYMHREFCGGQGVFCPPELARNDELTRSQQLCWTVSWSTGPSVFLLLIIYVVENHCIHYSDCMVSTICCYCSTITLEQFIVAAIMKRLQLVQPFVHRWHEVNGHLDMHYLADTEGFHVCVVSRTLWLTDIRTNTHSLTGIYIWSSIVGYPVLYFCNHKIDII